VGVSAADTKEVRVSYPAEPPGALAGQTVDYRLTVKGVKEKVRPALDDEFAKDLGKESLADLRQQVRAQLEAVERRKADRELKNALLDALVQRAHFEVPEALVERHMSARTESAARSLAFQGIDPTKVGMDWKQYREAQREEAVKGAKADILLDEIARREGIEATDVEVEEEVERFAERAGRPKDVVRARMEKEGDLQTLRARIREDKVLDLLRAGARLSSE
jgi:trigger factor